jgi:hypothetical protein
VPELLADQVEQQTDRDQRIPEKTGNDGRLHQRFKFFDVEAMDDALIVTPGRKRHGGTTSKEIHSP